VTVVATAGSPDPGAPLVVLLHGRGSDEQEILTLAGHLPATLAYASVRAPIAEGGGFAWFANRGIGRPLPDSLRAGLDWFREWLDDFAPAGRPVFLVGFSGGAAFAGGLLLDEPGRWAGAAILYGTLPFEAGVPVTAGRLTGVPVMVAQGDHDRVIPRELLDRTWEYIRSESGAVATARRDPVGHGIAPEALAALAEWLTSTQQAATATPSTPSGSPAPSEPARPAASAPPSGSPAVPSGSPAVPSGSPAVPSGSPAVPSGSPAVPSESPAVPFASPVGAAPSSPAPSVPSAPTDSAALVTPAAYSVVSPLAGPGVP
jgi:phospholipase/carboxylesterase